MKRNSLYTFVSEIYHYKNYICTSFINQNTIYHHFTTEISIINNADFYKPYYDFYTDIFEQEEK